MQEYEKRERFKNVEKGNLNEWQNLSTKVLACFQNVLVETNDGTHN